MQMRWPMRISNDWVKVTGSMRRPTSTNSLLPRVTRRGAVEKNQQTQEADMDLGIRGRTAIVCAASRGLRRATTALAREGANLVIKKLRSPPLLMISGATPASA